MSQILYRKDHTSISCPRRKKPRYTSHTKVRGMEFMVAVSLIVTGVWIMVAL